MPRLNLDIFSDSKNEVTESANDSGDARPKASEPSAAVLETENASERDTSNALHASPRFIPVGFYPEHLHLLDDAVSRLRRQGHWKASKSAIIRRLIDIHADGLDKIWLDTKE